MVCLTILILSVMYAPLTDAATDRVVCYYQSWAFYWKDQGSVKPENLDPNLCTHIDYAFIQVNGDGSLKVEDQYLDIDQNLFKKVTGLKAKNPKLKVLLSVGGAGDDRTKIFAQVAADPQKRSKFVQSAESFMTQYGFDGVDIDWEIPGKGDRGNYIALLSDVHTRFKTKGWLVTSAVPSSPSEGFDVGNMNKHLDQINIMAYDMYGSWSAYTGQNCPLYASSIESDYEKTHLNVAASIKNWKDAGADSAKINIGLGFYGRAFGLTNPNQHGLHAPFKGPAKPMPYTDSGWSYSYAEICQFTKDWTRVWDDQQKVPYKYKDSNWVGYEDPQSIDLQAKYAKSQGLGGIMMWSVDQDDVHGKCGEKFSLLRTIRRALGI